ncbi:MAG: cytochrome c biogenesis protein ResB [Candidatus Hydrogenedentes bacterium]|nr:cytochrome c biogenesis protein ResB [Candidatus Hydrogenedentota bacterium]
MRKAVKLTLDFLASYGFAGVIFLLLLLLVFLGTVEQVNQGLFEVQKKYFESIFLVHYFFGKIPVPLPGVYLLLALFTLNIMAGMVLRMRRGLAHLGVLIVHIGMVLMIVAGFVKFKFSDDGNLALWEHDQANVFESYHDYELAITPVGVSGPVKEYVITGDQFTKLRPEQVVTFQNAELPFDLTLTGFVKNGTPRQKGPMVTVSAKAVDGFYIEPLSIEKDAERNLPCAYVTVKDKKTGESQDGILVTSTRQPGFPPVAWYAQLDDKTWKVDLRKRQVQLPFTIVLDKFTHELHPRTAMAKAFMSDVTKIEDGSEQQVKIAMNEPLRHEGYTLFQSSFGPSNASPGERMYSVFAVVRNPSDQWPLYSCIIITVGLVVHFTQKLLKYLRAESKRRA